MGKNGEGDGTYSLMERGWRGTEVNLMGMGMVLGDGLEMGVIS
jgi:hypothetical protein